MAALTSSFKPLRIDTANVSMSWKSWYNEFYLALKLKNLEMGNDAQGNPRLTPQIQLYVLLHAVGEEGRGILFARGQEVTDPDMSYDDAVRTLKEHFQREESIFVKTQKFVTVHQGASEDFRDYLVRVERLSRDGQFARTNNAEANEVLERERLRFCLVLAINGLRDPKLRTDLMAREDMTEWAVLKNALTARSVARDSATVLGGNTTMVKQEVAEVTANPANYGPREAEPEVAAVSTYSDRHRPYRRGSSSFRTGSNSSRDSDSRDHRSDRRSRRSEGGDRVSFRDRSRGNYSSRKDYGYRRSKSPDYKRSKSPYGGWRQPPRYSSDSSDEDRYHRRARRESPRRETRRASRSPSGSEGDNSSCYECGSQNHRSRECPEAVCYRCRRRGHHAKDCGRSRGGRKDVRQVRISEEVSEIKRHSKT